MAYWQKTMYHIHIRCIQSVLAPWYAVDGHMGAPLYCYTCGGRGKILKNWGMGEPKWCWGVMVELQEASDCMPHPYWMYTMCFSTLICCGWAYGYTIALIPVQVGVNFGKLGGGGGQMTLGCHGWGCKPPLNASHIHIVSILSVWAPSYAVDGHHMGDRCTLTLWYMCRWWTKFWKLGGGEVHMTLGCYVLGHKLLLNTHPTSILYL